VTCRRQAAAGDRHPCRSQALKRRGNRRDFGHVALYLEVKCQRPFETERAVVTTQIGEQLDRAQCRARTRATVSDRSHATTAEPVPRIALTQRDGCPSRGSNKGILRGTRTSASQGCVIGWHAIVVKRTSRPAKGIPLAPQLVAHPARIGVAGRSSRSISPEPRPVFSLRDVGGLRHA